MYVHVEIVVIETLSIFVRKERDRIEHAMFSRITKILSLMSYNLLEIFDMIAYFKR